MEQDTQGAVRAWREALGSEHVLCGDAVRSYARDTAGDTRRIPCILRPADTEQVQAAVRLARRFRVPVHPVARGRNWGLGSRLPVGDDVAVLDLARMDRIRAIDADAHIAVVEPGVTQGRLFEALGGADAPLWLNVTGSGRETSVLGNALDRGVGYFRERADELSGMEVVLGTGVVLRTGFGRDARSRVVHRFRHGTGPSLDGLFLQSAFGVVTAAGVDLIPRPPAHLAVVASVPAEDGLAPLIDALAGLRRDGVIRTVIHVGNRERGEITLAPLIYDAWAAQRPGDPAALRAAAEDAVRREGFSAWSAVAGLLGTPGELRAARREIRRRLRGTARVMFLTATLFDRAERLLHALRALAWARRKAVVLGAVRPLFDLTRGIPTNLTLKSVYWPVRYPLPDVDDPLDPDTTPCGILYACPILPAEGRAVREATDETRRIFERHGFAPCITVNLLDDRSLEGVVSLGFDREDTARRDAAHRCLREAQDYYARAGFTPYRTGIAFMDQVVDPSDPYWQAVSDLKKAFDPDSIIAPGRYAPSGR